MSKINPKQLKPAKYKDRSEYPHITDMYEGELKAEFGDMLVDMSKEIGKKLNEIL
jgi:hypothetical protein